MHNTIHTITHNQTVLKWLNVDIRCTRLQCMADDQTDQADDGSLRSQFFELLQIFATSVIVARLCVADDLVHGGFASAVQALKGCIQFRRHRKARDNGSASYQAKGVQHIAIHRVDHRQNKLILVLRKRQCSGFLNESDRNALFHHREFGVVRYLNDR